MTGLQIFANIVIAAILVVGIGYAASFSTVPVFLVWLVQVLAVFLTFIYNFALTVFKIAK